MKAQKRQKGLTLNELIISLSVVAILLGMSAPSFSEFAGKRKVAGAANMVSVFFESIKMESIKRNEFATISFQTDEDGASWCLGAVMGQDTQCDCMAVPAQCKIDGVDTVLSNLTYTDFSDVEANFTDGFITFDPVRGILTNPSGSVLMEVTHVTQNYQVDVSVNATGSVRKCTPADHELAGYVKCI